jgi:hypothetical protein
MRKIVLLLLPIIIIGCEQSFDNIIDAVQNNYQVSLVSPTDSITFRTDDSLVTIRIIFTSSSEVNDVFCDVFASDQSKLNSAPFQLFDDNNDNRFLNEFPLSQFYPNGIYNIKYYVKNADETIQQVAIGNFKYNNGQDNVAPVVSKLVMPDSIQAGETILFYVEVSDSNGLNDIEFVFYEAYDPNGVRIVNSQGVFQFPMFDDGNTSENGDVTAGDGIFTVILTFPASAQKGTWRFEFQARDRSKLLSNKIIHNIIVL